MSPSSASRTSALPYAAGSPAPTIGPPEPTFSPGLAPPSPDPTSINLFSASAGQNKSTALAEANSLAYTPHMTEQFTLDQV